MAGNWRRENCRQSVRRINESPAAVCTAPGPQQIESAPATHAMQTCPPSAIAPPRYIIIPFPPITLFLTGPCSSTYLIRAFCTVVPRYKGLAGGKATSSKSDVDSVISYRLRRSE